MSDVEKVDAAQKHISDAMAELRTVDDNGSRFGFIQQLIQDLGDCHYSIDLIRVPLSQERAASK